ncbi:RagB/SusD family nutrient uptake outer membrane protein [Formosa sp. 3Alg 14/1]|uniref:RagB/SusD family nutrient uptake outer membrane protein n=1 Tax=Formosa sp. 3Alg 14/1 TaxID=3382190 RepID=UPI0039BECA47
MKHIKNYLKDTGINIPVYKYLYKITTCLIIFSLNVMNSSCSEFVDVDPPKNFLVAETVFNDPATVESALANIYYKMREQGLVSGRYGVSSLLGIYSDELDYYLFNSEYQEFYGHSIISSNTVVSGWWSHAYNVIYAANDIIKGVKSSDALSLEEKDVFLGQALFIRGYIHSLLVNLYGDIPYITTTNYLENNIVVRIPEETVYDNIIYDLTQAIPLLEGLEPSAERVIPNQATAIALLARIYLYTEQYELAEETATILISNHNLETDITKVFLKDSRETLWQFKPNGISDMNTYEANEFVIQSIPGQAYALSQTLLDEFEPNDLRVSNWIGTKISDDGSTTLKFAYKYKALFTELNSLEYSILFRLSEQYLIRAESRAKLGDVSGAQLDLNTIRNRAGLGNTSASNKEGLLNALLHERQVELFTEFGHRWFDLKRLGLVEKILQPIKPNWKSTDVLLPIPESELEKNPNLKPQNLGY